MQLRPNTNCDDSHCRAQQAKKPSLSGFQVPLIAREVQKPVVHEDNEWGEFLKDLI